MSIKKTRATEHDTLNNTFDQLAALNNSSKFIHNFHLERCLYLYFNLAFSLKIYYFSHVFI